MIVQEIWKKKQVKYAEWYKRVGKEIAEEFLGNNLDSDDWQGLGPLLASLGPSVHSREELFRLKKGKEE